MPRFDEIGVCYYRRSLSNTDVPYMNITLYYVVA